MSSYMRDRVSFIALDHLDVIPEDLEEVAGEKMGCVGILTKNSWAKRTHC